MRTSRSRTTPPPSDLRVGDYRLLTKIGEGGMGVVHLAQGPDGRRVALKLLRPHIVGDDEARERLSREVASLRRVRSPRIAEVIDADPWGETPFVATRYVPGLSLHQHARQEGPITGPDLRWFATGLAEAVIAVHGVGVLHRDIKPSNVLLEGRSPVLIDFGLARLADDPRLTVTGWLLGTPGYLAPEILYGDDATQASDVHSWAATVVFAATGRPPFGQGPAMAIMDRVRRGEHDLSDVPADVEPLLRACLAPDPAGRPGMTAALAELQPRRRRPRVLTGPATMPFALAAGHDDDPTDVIGTARLTERLEPAQDMAHTSPTGLPPASRPLHDTTGEAATTPLTVRRPAARTPYQQPAPADARPAWRPPSPGPARLCRAAILSGLFVLVAAGFAAAPYLCLGALALTALVMRTWSWTSEAAADRTWRRGRRWYDAPLAAMSAPWYLLVATGGTLMLVLSSAALAFLVGVGLLLFRAPIEAGLLVMGAVLAFSLWWGPGSRRLRGPSRALVLRLAHRTWLGWLAAALVGTLAAGCLYALGTGVSWVPQAGPPWRDGTVLGDLARFL